MRTPRAHYLSHNTAERSPHRVVCLDTETRWRAEGDLELHTLRLWVATLRVRTTVRGPRPEQLWAEGTTSAHLVRTLADWSRSGVTTWVYAHHLAFDLAVTRIVDHLVDDGWELGEHTLHTDAPWARLSRGRHRLVLADSASWLPRSIEALGSLLGRSKPSLPATDDDDAIWRARCRADVEILDAAMAQLMDWWDEHHLGCWSLTGTGCGWNAYRHHPGAPRILVDPTPTARALERDAIMAGRRDVWRTGRLPRGRYLVVDLERAHLTAARELPLPIRRGRFRASIPLDDPIWETDGWQPLATVTVRTDTPRYPWRHDNRVWHPIGTFRTTLAGPEIIEARRRGELVAVHGGYWYRMGAAMREWARWLTALLDGQIPDAPPMAHVVGKMWSHRVFGRWALRTSRPLRPYPSTARHWRLDHGVHHPSEARCSTLHLAGVATPWVHDQEGDDAVPAILAWIQSHVRVALGRMLDTVPNARIVSCNTDGMIVEAGPGVDLERMRAATAPFAPRVKAIHDDVEILGAAHTILDGRPRLSGVPAGADGTGPTGRAWTTWPSLRRQLGLGLPDGYAREHREVDLANIPVPRWRMADGCAHPIETMVNSVGTTRILPFVPSVAAMDCGNLADRQHPSLAPPLDPDDQAPNLGHPA